MYEDIKNAKIDMRDFIASKIFMFFDSVVRFITRDKNMRSSYYAAWDTYSHICEIDMDGIHNSYIFYDSDKVTVDFK